MPYALIRGIKELCIIGQDIGAYEKLPELLNNISKIDGNFWVRLLYIHPDHFPLEILDLMERDSRFLPYFDIPFQHASTKILTSMNRIGSQIFHTEASNLRFARRGEHGNEKGEKNRYIKLIQTIRNRLPNAVIRSTFMLGFPGETDEDFAELLDFQQKASLDWLGCFTYSREEGTASYSMKKRVPAKIAATRKQIIEEKQVPITEKNMDRFAGQTLDVLIEEQIAGTDLNIVNEKTQYSETFWLGRLYCQAPDIDGSAVIVSGKTTKKNGNKLQAGNLVPCKVITRRGFDLEVRLL